MSKVLECPKQIYVGIYDNSWENNPLAYVTYKLKNGEVYKKTSFENWCNEKVEKKTFDNTPQEGFKVLFTVGGCKSGWNVRQTYFRVVDPRGFQFEIVANNFVNILQSSVINQGVIEGKFAYGWQGQQLILIRDTDPAYIEGVKSKDIELTGEKVTKDNIKLGKAYRLRDYKIGYYIGRFKWYGYKKSIYDWRQIEKNETWNCVETPMYTFLCKNDFGVNTIAGYKEIKNVKFELSESISEEKVNEAVETFNNSQYSKPIDNLHIDYNPYDEAYEKKWYPESFIKYDEWVSKPFVNKEASSYNQNIVKFVKRFFYLRSENRFDIIIAFKFKDNSIKKYVYQSIYLSDDHKKIIRDNIIDESTGNYVNREDYFIYLRYKVEEWKGDTSKLEETRSYTICSIYNSYTIIDGHNEKINLDINKSFENISIEKTNII